MLLLEGTFTNICETLLEKKVHTEVINFSFKASFEYFAGNLWPYDTYSTITKRGKTHQD